MKEYLPQIWNAILKLTEKVSEIEDKIPDNTSNSKRKQAYSNLNKPNSRPNQDQRSPHGRRKGISSARQFHSAKHKMNREISDESKNGNAQNHLSLKSSNTSNQSLYSTYTKSRSRKSSVTTVSHVPGTSPLSKDMSDTSNFSMSPNNNNSKV